MSNLKPCGCGDSPTAVIGVDEVGTCCLGCGIFIYAETQEKADALWDDAMSARELREAKPKFRPDYLCGKPECESNTRGLLLEYSARIAELEAQNDFPRLPTKASVEDSRRLGHLFLSQEELDKLYERFEKETGKQLAQREDGGKGWYIIWLEAQVKAMRCCGNCKNGIVGQLDLENKTCMECADDDLWQPRAASKEG